MRRLISREDGIAMPLAMAALLMVTLMAGGVATTSMMASQAAGADREAKRALAAAEAGLQVGNLRLNNAPALGHAQCLIGAPVGAECPSYAEGDLGNGATYRFWISQRLAPGDTCGQVPTQTATGVERCITAQGTVGGSQRRVQTRVLDLATSATIVPIPGVFALNRVEFKNSSNIAGRVGSNKRVIASNHITVQGIDLGLTATLTASGGISYTQPPAAPVRYSPDKTLAAVPVGSTATVNRNGSIVSGGGVTYSAATRSLTLNGATLTLTQSGDYNFCRLVVSNGSSIRLAAGVTANVFIDAPDAVRPGSGCPSGAGWGEITSSNDTNINSPGSLANFNLFVVGWDPASAYAASEGVNLVQFANKMNLNGLMYAPHSHLDLLNNSVIAGAAGVYEITCHNQCTVNYGAEAANFEDPDVHYLLQGWRKCTPALPLAGDPESGC